MIKLNSILHKSSKLSKSGWNLPKTIFQIPSQSCLTMSHKNSQTIMINLQQFFFLSFQISKALQKPQETFIKQKKMKKSNTEISFMLPLLCYIFFVPFFFLILNHEKKF